MGFHNGNNIVTDGLILLLDMGNPKCFTSGETTCTNLITGGSVTGASGTPGSGAHTPNTANFPAYSSSKGGVFDFNGERGMNVEEDLGGSGSGAASWCLWHNKAANSGDDADNVDYIFDGRPGGGNWVLSNYQSHNVNAHSALEYNDGGSYDDDAPAINGVWNHLVMTSDSSGSKIYINGIDKTSIADTTNSMDEEFGVNYRIGTGHTSGNQWSGHMGVISFYNKKLSDAEVLQNYNAHRGRFL